MEVPSAQNSVVYRGTFTGVIGHVTGVCVFVYFTQWIQKDWTNAMSPLHQRRTIGPHWGTERPNACLIATSSLKHKTCLARLLARFCPHCCLGLRATQCQPLQNWGLNYQASRQLLGLLLSDFPRLADSEWPATRCLSFSSPLTLSDVKTAFKVQVEGVGERRCLKYGGISVCALFEAIL